MGSGEKSSMNTKLELNFRDRMGIIADMSALIAEYGFNILSMEVVRKDIETHVFVEIENRDPNTSRVHPHRMPGRQAVHQLLAEHFLFLLGSRLGKNSPAVTPAALEKLKAHQWPGNVRELKNLVERAAILSEGDVIDVDAILFSHEIERGVRGSKALPPLPKPHGQSLKSLVGDYEKQIIAEILKTSGSIRQAARTLQLSHTALLNKLKKYDIKPTTN
jgi:TyrR family helix-turn-helix protein